MDNPRHTPLLEKTPLQKMESLKSTMVDVPRNNHEALASWVVHGIVPGSFLCAVLRNNLKEACSRADFGNRISLHNTVAWLYNEAPEICWGSEHNFDAWRNAGGMEGK